MPNKNNKHDSLDRALKDWDETPRPKRILNGILALGACAVLAGGVAGATLGVKEAVKQIAQEEFPNFDPDRPSSIIDKVHSSGSDSGGIGLSITGIPNAPVVAYPEAGGQEEYLFSVKQNVKNGDEDRAEAKTVIWVDEETYREHKVGDIIVPSEEAEAIKGYTWYERIPED